MNMLNPIPMAQRDDTEIFPKGWYCVAESAEVAADVMLPVSYFDEQFIVYRDETGAARVADAYCPHLGAHLASHDGHIARGEIVCPFHKWRFSASTGKCTSIPYTKIVPPQAKLTLYPTREIAGLVLMWWNTGGGAPDFEPHDGMALRHEGTWILQDDQSRESRVPFRDLFENLFDTAHVETLHGSQNVPGIDRITRTDYGLQVDYETAKNSGERFKLTGMQGHFTGIGMLSQLIEGEGFAFSQTVTATPIDRERLKLRTRLYIRDTGDARKNEQIGGTFVASTVYQADQDLAVLNYKKHLKQPLICAGDGPILKFRDYAREFF